MAGFGSVLMDFYRKNPADPAAASRRGVRLRVDEEEEERRRRAVAQPPGAERATGMWSPLPAAAKRQVLERPGTAGVLLSTLPPASRRVLIEQAAAIGPQPEDVDFSQQGVLDLGGPLTPPAERQATIAGLEAGADAAAQHAAATNEDIVAQETASQQALAADRAQFDLAVKYGTRDPSAIRAAQQRERSAAEGPAAGGARAQGNILAAAAAMNPYRGAELPPGPATSWQPETMKTTTEKTAISSLMSQGMTYNRAREAVARLSAEGEMGGIIPAAEGAPHGAGATWVGRGPVRYEKALSQYRDLEGNPVPGARVVEAGPDILTQRHQLEAAAPGEQLRTESALMAANVKTAQAQADTESAFAKAAGAVSPSTLLSGGEQGMNPMDEAAWWSNQATEARKRGDTRSAELYEEKALNAIGKKTVTRSGIFSDSKTIEDIPATGTPLAAPKPAASVSVTGSGWGPNYPSGGVPDWMRRGPTGPRGAQGETGIPAVAGAASSLLGQTRPAARPTGPFPSARPFTAGAVQTMLPGITHPQAVARQVRKMPDQQLMAYATRTGNREAIMELRRRRALVMA